MSPPSHVLKKIQKESKSKEDLISPAPRQGSFLLQSTNQSPGAGLEGGSGHLRWAKSTRAGPSQIEGDTYGIHTRSASLLVSHLERLARAQKVGGRRGGRPASKEPPSFLPPRQGGVPAESPALPPPPDSARPKAALRRPGREMKSHIPGAPK